VVITLVWECISCETIGLSYNDDNIVWINIWLLLEQNAINAYIYINTNYNNDNILRNWVHL